MRSVPGGRPGAVAVLVFLTLATFWPLLGHEFNEFDDVKYVTRNAHVQNGLTADGIRWALTSFHASNWHPLTWMSHMADWSLFGGWAGGHHLVSLLLHLANACLLFLALDAMTGAPGRSLAVAALFAVHPLHVESVAWVAERKDVLSTLFWMLATLAYVRYARTPRASRMAAVAILFALGLAAKPMLVTLPFTLLLLDVWPLRRPVSASLVLEKLPLFALAATSCLVTLAAQRGAIGTGDAYPAAARIANASVAYGSYLAKTVWPIDLAVFYPYTPRPILSVPVIASALALTALTAGALRLRTAKPYAWTGWLWYLGTLVPVIGFVQVGRQAAADRYTYVPLVGIFVVAAWGAYDALAATARRAALRAAPVLAVAAIAVFAAGTRLQLRHWQDAVTLFRRAVEVADSDVARTNLGEAYRTRGRMDEAADQYRAALRLNPQVYQAENGLGLVLERQGRMDEARARFESALRIDPGYRVAHKNLGRVLAASGRPDDAIRELLIAVEGEPGDAEAEGLLALTLASRGRATEALPHYDAAIRSDPRSPELRNNRGSALADLGRWDEAEAEFLEATRLRPGYGRAHCNLATALYSRGRYADAWREVHTARALGIAASPRFLEMLGAKMADPGN